MRTRLAHTFAALLALGALLLATRARAATCAPIAALGPAAAPVAALDPERRLRFIDAELARSAHHAKVWTWGWGVALGVGAVANLAPLLWVPKDERIDWYTGAFTNTVGVVPLLIAPLDVIGDSRELRARLAARDARDVCALLADAEARLVRDAQNQADGRRWWLHLANFALNAGVGLFLGVGFHHWGAGLFQFASGAVIGEVILFTQPTGAIDSLREYRDGELDGGAGPPRAIGFGGRF
ncbi:MAG TPA: hypothetical protein VHL80_04195 [Polyangia bacterium]|nr:hypothetical protein [Polyangia bacterium]